MKSKAKKKLDRSLRLRRLWIVTHRWLGIALFIPLLLLGLTGAGLVWPDATERFFYPERFNDVSDYQERPVADYVSAALKAMPKGESVGMIFLPNQPGEAIVVSGAPYWRDRVGPPARNRVWLDPITNNPVATWDHSPDLIWFLHALHGHLAMQGAGRSLVGWLGIVLLFSALSGIWIWWPVNGGFKVGLRWRRTPRWSSNLHFISGIWAAVPLALVALTGTWIVFPDFFGIPVAVIAGEDLPEGGHGHRERMSEWPQAKPMVSAEEALDIARREGMGGRLLSITMPTNLQKNWMVQLSCSTVAPCIERFTVDSETGSVTEIIAQETTAVGAVAGEMESIHIGASWGVLWKIILFACGLLPTVFGITGIIMWWKRSIKKWKRKLSATTGA